MSIEHHPTDSMLAAFAAGTLDLGQHVAIATHLMACPQCRGFVRAMEKVGGAMLIGLTPAAISGRALAQAQERLSDPKQPATANETSLVLDGEIPGLPAFVRRYRFGDWRWVAPSVRVRPVVLPHSSSTRVFLLKSGPGTKMLQHTHTGTEMTCVLSGAYRQDGSLFGPGDFDLGDDTVEHQPVVEAGEDCLCLVAMQGDLQLKGLIGRIVQPFVRL